MPKIIQNQFKVLNLQSIGSEYAIINGESVLIDDENHVTPFIENGRTLIPARFIAETFGATVEFKDNTVYITYNGIESKIGIGDKVLSVGYRAVALDVEAKIINGRAMLPLRAICEDVLGKSIKYENGEITISENSIIYSVTQPINLDLKDFTFDLYSCSSKNDEYIRVSKIVISDDDKTFKQELNFEMTFIPNGSDDYCGFSLDDWNFDGYLDICLWRIPGGTMHNMPCYYWIWDNNVNQYVRNAELEELSDSSTLTVNVEKKELESFTRITPGLYENSYYKLIDNSYVLIRQEDTQFEYTDDKFDTSKEHVTVYELIDGQMKVTDDFYRDNTEN